MSLSIHSDTINGSYIQTEGGKIVPSGRRNYLINGNFDSWQYGTSQTTSGYGSDDRWGNGSAGSTKVHSQAICTDTEYALFNARKYSRTVVTSVIGVDNVVNKYQKIETVTMLAGKTVTLSFWAKADTAKNIAIEFGQRFGTGGSPSADVNGIGSQLVALTTTWQKKTITVTIPSIVGKTIGADGVHTSNTIILFYFDAGSNYNSRASNLGQQSGTFDIAQVKLEDGAVATDGWHPYDGEFGGEVQACQRYLPSLVATALPSTIGVGYSWTTTKILLAIQFKTAARIPPTGITATSGGWSSGNGAGAVVTTAKYSAMVHKSENVALLEFTSSGLTVGQGAYLFANTLGNKILFTGCEL